MMNLDLGSANAVLLGALVHNIHATPDTESREVGGAEIRSVRSVSRTTHTQTNPLPVNTCNMK
jgi:hypothetical protein